MVDLPGYLLVRSGLVTSDQVAAAHRLTEQNGSSFGEAVVTLGILSEKELVAFYHKRLMIPALDEESLSAIPNSVLELLPGDMAAEFRVIPVEIDKEGSVVLAMSDPSNNHAVDEVAFFIDRFLVRAVASESAVRSAIERHYGIDLSRAAAPERARKRTKTPSPVVVAAPTADIIPEAQATAPAEHAVEPERKRKRTKTPSPVVAPAAAIVEAEPVPAVEAQPAPAVEAQPAPAPVVASESPAEDRPRKRTRTPAIISPPPAIEPPVEALRVAVNRDEVANLMLDYLAGLMQRSLFLVVKKSELRVHAARGVSKQGDAVSGLKIDLSELSVFRDVVQSLLPYRGPLPTTGVAKQFTTSLGGGMAGDSVLMPVRVRNRVIGILYADGPTTVIPDAALHAMVGEASRAYERILLSAK